MLPGRPYTDGMVRLALSLALLGINLGSLGCQKANSDEKSEGFRLINADALAAMQADTAHPVHIYDANHDEFRKEEGVIAGASLLSGSDFDVAATLPKDKGAPLVFYCSSKL